MNETTAERLLRELNNTPVNVTLTMREIQDLRLALAIWKEEIEDLPTESRMKHDWYGRELMLDYKLMNAEEEARCKFDERRGVDDERINKEEQFHCTPRGGGSLYLGMKVVYENGDVHIHVKNNENEAPFATYAESDFWEQYIPVQVMADFQLPEKEFGQ